MFNLAFRIWFTAQLVFIAMLGIWYVFTGGGGEGIAGGLIIFFVGMACSAPALFLLNWLLKAALMLANNMRQAMLAATITAAVSALITYTGWWLFLRSPDFSARDFSEGLGFLLSVIGCTTAATLLHYRQFRHFNRQIISSTSK